MGGKRSTGQGKTEKKENIEERKRKYKQKMKMVKKKEDEDGLRGRDEDTGKKKEKTRLSKPEEKDLRKKMMKWLRMNQSQLEEGILLIIQMNCHQCPQQMNQTLWRKRL